MKPVAAIFGLVVAFIALSVLVQQPKKLHPTPQEKEAEAQQTPPNQPAKPQAFNAPKEGLITTELTIKNRGVVSIEFYPKAAPRAVEQITGLIKQGFYDGIIVHRVETGMVVQFGNPRTKTMGVDANEVDGDIPLLTFEDNDLTHVPGAIGLARRSEKDTASSQLFIDLQDNPMWNKEYCVIARAVTGLDVLKKVQRGDEITSFKIK